MKKFILTFSLVLLSLFATAEVLDKIVAKVGSDIILLSDVQKQMQRLKSTGMVQGEVKALDVLDQMIENRLIIQKAKELNIQIDDAQVRSQAERYIRDIKKNYPTEADFLRELRNMKLTQSDLTRFYIEQLTENALSEKIIQSQILSRIKINEKDMLDFYEATKDSLAVKPISYNISMLMREVKASEDTEREKLAEINAILDRIKAGEDFATLAREHSDCPSKEDGGNLGFFKKGMMVKEFEDAAFNLAVGQYSEVVKTQFGYHIIKVEERKGDEIRARHILKIVQSADQDKDREQALMSSLRERYLNGESFADLATQYSMDEESASEGGDIGEFTIKELPELFSTVLQSIKVGDVTPVLENEGLLYLFVKQSENPSRLYSFEEVRSQVQRYLFQLKQMEEYDTWIADLKKNSYLEISL